MTRRHFLEMMSTSVVPIIGVASTKPVFSKESKPMKKPVNVKLWVDSKEKNSIGFEWQRWRTDLMHLWMPEACSFLGDDDVLWVKEQVGWSQDGPNIRVDGMKLTHGDYRFEWDGMLVPCKDKVDITLKVRNTSKVAKMPEFNINGCFNFIKAPDFMDSTGGYTFFRTQQGWHDMSTLRRPLSKIYGHDPYNIPLKGYGEAKFTETGESVSAVSSLVVRVGRLGTACIGYAWNKGYRIDINYNRLHCMHSVPSLGPLLPGESVTRRGVFYFHEGDKEDLLEFCKRDGMS